MNEFDEFVDHVRKTTVKQMDESAFVMSLCTDKEVDVKFAVELGLSIMLDKPIMAVVMPGVQLPPKLVQIADLVVEADIDTEAGQDALIDGIGKMKALYG